MSQWDEAEPDTDEEANVAKPRRSLVWLIAAFVVAGILAVSVAINLRGGVEHFTATDPRLIPLPTLAPDPRLTFASPFRNIHPDVEFVGDKVCAQCHKEIDKSFHAHPMGRSAITTVDSLEQFDDAAKASSQYEGWDWSNTATEGHLVQTLARADAKGKTIAELQYKPELIIGSGTMGRSYIESRGGEAWQTPVSWFTTIHQWDVSPAATAYNDLSMPTDARCLGCHIQNVPMVAFSQHRLSGPLNAAQVNIGCERCHGPGHLHVHERTSGAAIVDGIDTSIVNPRHLSVELRMAICQQCHMSGFGEATSLGRLRSEFRPGMPLELFVSVYTVPPGESKGRSVQQFEQMLESRCYTESAGTFDCVTCHNPHEKPSKAESASYFRERCLKCHQDKPCMAPEERRQKVADACISCHMPRAESASVAHASVTDHRILRDKNQERTFAPSTAMVRPGLPFVPVSLGKSVLSKQQEERNLGVALAAMMQASEGPADPQSPVLAAAHELLTAATTRNPQDHDAWLGLATLEKLRNNMPAALEVARKAVAAVPHSEIGLRQLATLAIDSSDGQTAADATLRLMQLNPESPTHLRLRGQAQLVLGQTSAASHSLKQAVAVQPLDGGLRFLLAIALKESGNLRAAETELAQAMALTDDLGLRSEYRRQFHDDAQR